MASASIGRHPSLPKEIEQNFDLGYKGVKKDFPDLNCVVPYKRNRWHKKLTPRQKEFNHKLAKARVMVEHTISRMKKFNIFGQEFRNSSRHYDKMSDIVSGLINFRIMGSMGLLL